MSGADAVDVLVIGGGPAGSVAACVAADRLKARGGLVVLVDRGTFPRDKVCGGCLATRGVHTLQREGIWSADVERHTRPLGEVVVHHEGRRLRLPMQPGRVVDRVTFDVALLDTARERGVMVMTGEAAEVQPIGDGGHEVRVRVGERTLAARVVLVADGLGGTSLKRLDGFGVEVAPASRLGAAVTLPEAAGVFDAEALHMHVGAGGYIGVVRFADGRAHLAAALDPAAVKAAGSPASAMAALLGGGVTGDTLQAAGVMLTPRLTRTRARVAGHRLLVVGDATGYVEPFTGEGMSWAITSATFAAEVATANLDAWDESAEARWGELHAREVQRRQRTCRLLAHVLRRPRLTGGVVQLLRAFPFAARPLTRRIAA